MAITKEQIFQAADQLAAEGEAPTLANVRKALGGGSFTTISEAMNEWKAKQQATTAPLREPAPAAVATRLHELGADIWGIALELANSRLSSEREALETARTQLETAQQEATELADQLSAELETLQAQHRQTSEALQAASTTIQALQQENATLSRQLATTEARAEETTKRADDLKAELQHAHAASEAQQQRLTQAQAEREQALQAASATREDAAGMRGELEALRVQNAALLATLTPPAPSTPKAKATKPPKT
jgi:chromosome segregation ATPase